MEPQSSREDWRDLARRVENEENPAKMIDLIERLLARYDEQKGSMDAQGSDLHFPAPTKP